MPEQLVALTSLRGIAALLVVVYHLSGTALPDLNLGARSAFVGKGYLCVDLFFVLSGFIMMHVYGRWFRERVAWPAVRTFLLARVARIYPLYVFVLLAFLGLEAAKLAIDHAGIVHFASPPFSHADSRSPGAFVVDLLMLQATGIERGLNWNYPAWSVGAEVWAYLAFPLLALLLWRLGWGVRALLVAAGLAGLWALSRDGVDLDVTWDGGMLRCLLEFAGGVVLYLLHDSRIGARWLGSDAALVAVGSAIVLAMQFRAPDVLLPPLFALLIVAAAQARGRVARCLACRPLVFLGDISYAMYLTHVLVLEVAVLGWRAATGQHFGAHFGVLASVLTVAVLVGAVMLAATMLHRSVERPARAALKRGIGRLAPPRRLQEGGAVR